MSESSKFPSLRGRTPVDGLARRVAGPGERHDVALLADESETPLPTWKFDGRRGDDLTGRKRGMLTVIGYAAVESGYRGWGNRPKPQSVRGALWIARCVCGVYVRRRTKSLKKVGSDACSRCTRKGLGGRPANR